MWNPLFLPWDCSARRMKLFSYTISIPFNDVPEWASDYVGYIYTCGLLDDIIDGAENYNNLKFEPQKGESTERFMSYMLYALAIPYRAGDYCILHGGGLDAEASAYA